MSALTLEARRVHDDANLSDRQIAAATGAKPSTVRDWLTGRSVPSGSRAERLVELAEIAARLRRVMDADYIPGWLKRELEVADLRDAQRLERVGLEMPVPTRRTWPAYQAVGAELWREGASGLIAPSAARPQQHVLCVFTEESPPAGCTPVRAIRVTKVP